MTYVRRYHYNPPHHAPIAQGLERCSYKANVAGSIPARRTIYNPNLGAIHMGYHDRDTFEKRWRMQPEKQEQSENPRMQIISPTKKLHDIQQVINSLPNKQMTMYELQEAIQRILDGE